MRMKQETYRGQLYYTARPGEGSPWREIQAWCTQMYGPAGGPGDRWSSNDIVKGGKLWFKDEQDIMWFRMKWS